MQFTGHFGLLTPGKASSHIMQYGTTLLFNYFSPVCDVFVFPYHQLCEAYSFTTDGYGVFNVGFYHRRILLHTQKRKAFYHTKRTEHATRARSDCAIYSIRHHHHHHYHHHHHHHHHHMSPWYDLRGWLGVKNQLSTYHYHHNLNYWI